MFLWMLSKYYSVFLFPRSSHCVSYIHKWRISINSGHHRRPFCFFSSFGCKIPGPENEHVGGVILTRKEQNKHKKISIHCLQSIQFKTHTHAFQFTHHLTPIVPPPGAAMWSTHTDTHTYIYIYLSVSWPLTIHPQRQPSTFITIFFYYYYFYQK